MERNGMLSHITITVLLGVITMIILLTIIIQHTLSKEELANLKCRRSVAAAYAAKLTGQSLIDAVKCPFRIKELKKPSKEEAMEALAKKMAICWRNFYRGELSIFDTKTATFCIPCSIVKIKDVNWKINGREFLSYLNKTKVPGKKESYLAYLTNQDNKMISYFLIQNEGAKNFNFSIEKANYVIMFTENKMVYKKGNLITMLGSAAIGSGIALIMGASPLVAIAGGIGGAIFGAISASNLPYFIKKEMGIENKIETRIPAIIVIKYQEGKEKEARNIIQNQLGCVLPTKFG